MNEYARKKKLKSLSLGVFLVRYKKTYVLNNSDKWGLNKHSMNRNLLRFNLPDLKVKVKR